VRGGREWVPPQVVSGHEETLEARPERLLLGHAGDAGHALAVGDLDGRVVGHSGEWFGTLESRGTYLYPTGTQGQTTNILGRF